MAPLWHMIAAGIGQLLRPVGCPHQSGWTNFGGGRAIHSGPGSDQSIAPSTAASIGSLEIDARETRLALHTVTRCPTHQKMHDKSTVVGTEHANISRRARVRDDHVIQIWHIPTGEPRSAALTCSLLLQPLTIDVALLTECSGSSWPRVGLLLHERIHSGVFGAAILHTRVIQRGVLHEKAQPCLALGVILSELIRRALNGA